MLHSEPLYGGTEYFLGQVLPRFGVHSIGFPAGELPSRSRRSLARAAKADKLAMIYVETPGNPTNALVDLEMCSKIARAHSTSSRRVVVAVDNTFLGPLWQHPLKFGVDLVLYSATKFIGGHSDVIAGVCLGSTS